LELRAALQSLLRSALTALTAAAPLCSDGFDLRLALRCSAAALLCSDGFDLRLAVVVDFTETMGQYGSSPLAQTLTVTPTGYPEYEKFTQHWESTWSAASTFPLTFDYHQAYGTGATAKSIDYYWHEDIRPDHPPMSYGWELTPKNIEGTRASFHLLSRLLSPSMAFSPAACTSSRMLAPLLARPPAPAAVASPCLRGSSP
jgi:hypothetical protein